MEELSRGLDGQHNGTHNGGVMGRQLIVIGNGFDLACDLKSSYEAFFSGRLQIANDIWRYECVEWERAVDRNHLTAWDFILQNGVKGPDWCNVEKALGDWVLPVDENGDGQSPLGELLEILGKYPFSDPNGYSWSSGSVSGPSERALHLRDVSRCIWHKMGHQSAEAMDRSRLLAFLRSELSDLEAQFKDYLLGQCKSHGSRYTSDALRLMSDIALDGYSDAEDYDKAHTSVLSFNYTTPIDGTNCVVDKVNVVNVHGSLDGEIVFGVDGKECMDDLDALPFTKTYRVASMGVNMGSNPLYDTVMGTNGGSATGCIKFFGHSLGEADYSYFQSIFDGVNLYAGSTRLVFYYRPWGNKDKVKLRAETVRKVTKLLVVYGSTLDNREHGKNLMHKLLLEGRLEVKELVKRRDVWNR